MEKIRQQILFEADIFTWLREEQIGRRHKNLSQTVGELLKNYQIMIKSVDRAREAAERQDKARQEAQEMIAKYRGQIVDGEKNKIL